MDYQIIKYEDELYPEKLRRINNPPKVLYAKGNVGLLKEDMIAVVGTRKITEYGKRMARKFCNEIAKRNIPIISGMALGTDSEAHISALENFSPTIAVLGTGINEIFPKENEEMYNRILDSGGLILSEVGVDVKYNSKHFPRRNRIVSGLSECVLVIEAAYRSGTSITVRYAKEQGKKVFAVPGCLDNKYGVGVNKFLKDGAILATDINDLLECYPQFMHKKGKTTYEKKIKKEYKEIYNLIEEGNTLIDEIIKKSSEKEVSKVIQKLTLMELENLIEQESGNCYKIKY